MKTRTPALIRFLSLFIGLLSYHTPSLQAAVSPDVPMEHPVQANLERLSSRRLISNDLHAIRPVTEFQLKRLAQEARKNLGTEADQDVDLRAVETYLVIKESGRAELRGGLLGTNAESVPVPEVDASINPLLEHQGGRWQQGGIAGWIEPRISFQWQGWGAVDVRPFLPMQWSPEGDGKSLRADIYTAALKLGHGGTELQLGRFPIRWGHSKSGSLILGGDQKPLDGLQVRNAEPVELPWIFRYLGPVQFSFLVNRLSAAQDFPHSYMVSERLGIRPTPALELGFAQSIILGGSGSPDLGPSEAISEVLGRRLTNINQVNLSNRMFLLDFLWRISWLHDAALYSELYFEDCCTILNGRFARNMANMVGIQIPNLGANGYSTLTFEWVRTTEITGRNSTFTSGFADRNHLFGHTIGPDAMAFYLYGDHSLSSELQIQGRIGFERRGRNENDQGGNDIRGVVPTFDKPEDRLSFFVTPTWIPRHDLFLRGSVGYEWVNHFLFENRETKHQAYGSLETGFLF